MSSLRSSYPIQSRVSDDKTDLLSILGELFEHVPEAILLLDDFARVIRVNREFVGVFGYSRGEVIGRTVSSLIVPEELLDEADRFANHLPAQHETRIFSCRVQSYRVVTTGLETGVHHGETVTSHCHNLAYCYNDARVIKWMWENVKRGFRGGVRSFEDQ